MKKISILVLHLGYGGAEKAIINLANSLVYEYDIEIISVYKLYDNPPFLLDNRVVVKYLIDEVPNRDKINLAIKNKNLLNIVKELLFAIKVLYKRRKYMKMAISNCDCDVIISSRVLFNSWIAKVKKDNVIKIAWEHNHHNDDKKHIDKRIKSCKNLDYMVNVSNELANFYKDKLSNSGCKSVYIPNMIEKQNEISLLKNKNIVSVGRLEPEKGFLDLIDVFNDVLVIHPDCLLNIVGDGSQKSLIEEKIKQYGISGSVIMHGFKKTDYINNLLAKQSVYVMTSYTESFGISLVEAMNAGVPCVAFDSAQGATEIINDNKNGYLVKNRDKKEMVNKINYLLSNYDVRTKIGECAIKCGKKYQPNLVVKEWEKIFDNKI